MTASGVVNIRGKEYKTVALRVSEFREKYGTEMALLSEIIQLTDEVVVVKAMIVDQGGRVLATGHAEEKRASSQINRTSALENAETSAFGRALAALGFGGSEFASAEEVANAIHQQSRAEKVRKMKQEKANEAKNRGVEGSQEGEGDGFLDW